jgi:hypothetical protein
MLGRLEMNVDECITAYKDLCSQVFVKERVPLSWTGKVKGRFDSKILERVIKDFVGKHLEGRNAETEPFNDSKNGKQRNCKV